MRNVMKYMSVAVLIGVAGSTYAAFTTTNFVDAAALRSNEIFQDGLGTIPLKDAKYSSGALRYGLLRTDLSGITTNVTAAMLDYTVKQQAEDTSWTIYFWGVIDGAPGQDWNSTTDTMADVAPTNGTGMFTATEDLEAANDPNLVLLGSRVVPGSGSASTPNLAQSISGQALVDWLNTDTDGDATIVISMGENLNASFRSITHAEFPSLSYSVDPADADLTQFFQIGGALQHRDAAWNHATVGGSFTTCTYSFADATDPQLVFTFSAAVGNPLDTLVLGSNLISVDSTARNPSNHTGRIDYDESVTVTVSYVDPNESLATLGMSGVGPYWATGSAEETVVTDALGSNYTFAAFENDTPVQGNWGDLVVGLQDLTAANTNTWSLTWTAGNTNTTTGVGGFAIKYLLGEVIYDPYADWAATNGLTAGVNDGFYDDAEAGGGDGVNNLMEYALGGDPLLDDAAAIVPVGHVDAGYLNYVFKRRTDAATRGLDYNVYSSTDLVTGALSNATEFAGSGGLGGGFESATNRVPTAGEDKQFMSLEVGISE